MYVILQKLDMVCLKMMKKNWSMPLSFPCLKTVIPYSDTALPTCLQLKKKGLLLIHSCEKEKEMIFLLFYLLCIGFHWNPEWNLKFSSSPTKFSLFYLKKLKVPYYPIRIMCSQNAGSLVVPVIFRSNLGGRTFSHQAPIFWNQLPVQICRGDTLFMCPTIHLARLLLLCSTLSCSSPCVTNFTPGSFSTESLCLIVSQLSDDVGVSVLLATCYPLEMWPCVWNHDHFHLS